MPKAKPDLKAECIRLRVEEGKSFRDIEAATGASKGSLSIWLKPYPLPAEASRKNWVRYRPPKKDRGEESKYHQMTVGRNLDGNQRGKIAEAAVLLRLTILGFDVFGAVVDGTKADWVVQTPKSGKLWKIQVKLARTQQEGLPMVNLRCSQSASKYDSKDVDFIVGYDLFADTAYVWAWSEVEHLSSSISVSEGAAERWDKLENGV